MPVKEKRRLEVLLETHEITKVSFRNGFSAGVLCEVCGIDTLHLSISEAASILQSSESAILQFAQTNQVHSVENAAGSLLVCGNSLAIFKTGSHEK
jgi:hypothetical protein